MFPLDFDAALFVISFMAVRLAVPVTLLMLVSKALRTYLPQGY